MQREHKEIFENAIVRHFGMLFWQQCCNCKRDFRRENGWLFIADPYCNGIGTKYYLCEKCAPALNDANVLAINGCYKPLKPIYISPPPPPCR